MAERRVDDRYPQVDTGPTAHERSVAQEEKEHVQDVVPSEDPTAEPAGRRPTSQEDLAADQGVDDLKGEDRTR